MKNSNTADKLAEVSAGRSGEPSDGPWLQEAAAAASLCSLLRPTSSPVRTLEFPADLWGTGLDLFGDVIAECLVFSHGQVSSFRGGFDGFFHISAGR